jgi:hypothetical protein
VVNHLLLTKQNFIDMKNKLTKLFIGLFIGLVLIGCSARKTQTEIIKEESNVVNSDNSIVDEKSETNVKQISTVAVDDKNEIFSKEEVYEPIDSDKEASIIDSNGNKIILNNSKKTTKTITRKNNIQTKMNSNLDSKRNNASNEQKKINQTSTYKKNNKVKFVDKKTFNWFNLLFLIVPLALLYYLFKKYREKIWWI